MFDTKSTKRLLDAVNENVRGDTPIPPQAVLSEMFKKIDVKGGTKRFKLDDKYHVLERGRKIPIDPLMSAAFTEMTRDVKAGGNDKVLSVRVEYDWTHISGSNGYTQDFRYYFDRGEWDVEI